MLKRISAAQAIYELTVNTTVFYYVHKSSQGWSADNFDEPALAGLLADVKRETVERSQHRMGFPKSYGVKFSSGSELRLYGQKGKTDCFKFKFPELMLDGVYVDCGYAAMIYIIDNL